MTLTVDDADLIRSFKLGDDTVFEAIVHEYRPELLRHARRRTLDDGTAEDLVQETFVRAYRAFHRLRDDSCVRPWLHHILANVCIDEANRARREHDKAARAAIDPLLHPVVPGADHQLGLDIDSDSLGRALSRLPDTHRDALTMRFVDQLDYDEIAAHTGVSELNVRARVSRARTAMRHALQAAGAAVVAGVMVLRRGARTAAAASASPDSAGAAAASGSAGHAGRLATTLAPAIEAANAVATTGQNTLPLLAKAAVGVGAVAAVALSAGPEQPVERVAPVVVEAEASTLAADLTIDTPIVVTPAPRPTPAAGMSALTGADDPATEPAATDTAEQAAAQAAAEQAAAEQAAAEQAAADEAAADEAAADEAAADDGANDEAPVDEVVAVPLLGGALDATLTVTVAGPRLDVTGPATLTVGDVTVSGTLSGRLGIEAPAPDGTRRLSGVLTLQLDTGTIELRLAGYATTDDPAAATEIPASMTLTGVYRAAGTTGELATAGTFHASLSGGTLTLALAP